MKADSNNTKEIFTAQGQKPLYKVKIKDKKSKRDNFIKAFKVFFGKRREV